MYTSPIEKIYGEMRTQMVKEDENMVINAVREVGVNVDKEELIKALQYDRNQYTRGYKDGKSDVLDKIKAEIENHCRYCPSCYNLMGVREILEVIDKYKAGNEE